MSPFNLSDKLRQVADLNVLNDKSEMKHIGHDKLKQSSQQQQIKILLGCKCYDDSMFSFKTMTHFTSIKQKLAEVEI